MSKEYLLELTKCLPEMKIEKQIKVNHRQIYEIVKSNENPLSKRSFMIKVTLLFSLEFEQSIGCSFLFSKYSPIKYLKWGLLMHY